MQEGVLPIGVKLRREVLQDQRLVHGQRLLWMRKSLDVIPLLCNLDLLPDLVFPIPLTDVRHTPDSRNAKVNTRKATNTEQPGAIPDQLRYPRVVQDNTYDPYTGCETNQGASPQQRHRQ